jgi:hypothetical protein
MSIDPGLQNDTCPFLEANAGDGGNHNVNGQWWLSPDIALVGPTSGPDQADSGKQNTITVTANLKAGCTPDASAHNVLVELWIGNPALAMSPNVNTRQIQATALIALGSFDSGTHKGNHIFSWTPPSGAVDPDPEAPGHKCLIARVYTDAIGIIPDGSSFHLADDPHSAQHNITIVAAPVGGKMRIVISTGNPAKKPQKVNIDVMQDLKPSAFVMKAITPGLQRLNFTGISNRPTTAALETTNFQRHIATELIQAKPGLATPAKPSAPAETVTHGAANVASHLTGAAIQAIETVAHFSADASGLFGGVAHPNVRSTLPLKPQVFDTFALTADLTHAQKGHAVVYHATQTGADGKPQGGLTVVVLPR